MDSISTTPVPASDIPINQGNNRSINRRLSTRFPSSKDATYPDDIVNEFGSTNRSLNRNASKAQRGSPSTKYDPSMSMRRSGTDGECEEDESEEEEEGEEEPVRMSLMALLAESEGSSYMMGEDEDEDEDEDDGGGDNLNNCCVCQVRHKGAAFVPCGHSFCRLCSRELWVEGANCPLCNNFILEILDIF
ncbi:hypothetical protein EJD97_016426 [Solanum chilense]|uniref:RING-type domain-containing protein n=1 Tax=Solanum chilense TaxID=4083 RepID=A0A6N2B7E9_SOLCI|nr:hypothetical protein EJD97_016426 [Solanum chilense]